MTATATARDERRRSRRVRRRLNVTLTRKTGEEIHAQTADVSAFGVRLLLDRNVVFAKGERMRLEFQEIGAVTEVAVVWAARRQDCVFAGFEKVPVLSGDVSTTPLYEILFGLVMRRMTGELRFLRGTVNKAVYLDMGEIIYADSDQDYDSLPSVLVRGGRITQEEFDEAWATHVKRPTTPLSKILVEMGCLNAESLNEAEEFRTRRIVRGLFEWTAGHFEFSEHKRPPREHKRLGMSTADLIVSGIRNMPIERVRQILTPILDIPVAVTEDPLRLYQHITLMEKEKRLFDLVDGKSTLRQLLKDSGLSDVAAMGAAMVLLGACLVELGELLQDEDVPEPGTSRLSADDEAIAARVDRIYYRLGEMTHYDVLGLPQTASPSEIKKAYYNMARDFHPDLNHRLGPAYEPKLHAIFTRINDVYHVLSDEKRRRDYDKTIYVGARRAGATPKAAAPGKNKPTAADRYRQGNLKYKAGDYAAALNFYRMAVALEPEKAIYHFAAGKASMQVPRGMKEAEESFLKAIELEPYNTNYQVELGRLYLKARLATRARRTFTGVLNVEPDNEAARAGLAAADRLK